MRSGRSPRIALFTYSTQPRGGVAHAIELGGALHDLGHDVVLYGLDDTGAGFFRTPRCRSYAIPVARATRGVSRAVSGRDGAGAAGEADVGPPASARNEAESGLLALVSARVETYVDAWERVGERFDVYHAHDGISGNALATLVERGRIGEFVRTVHHADDFANPALAELQRRSIVAASAVYAVSDHWRGVVRERFGADASRVRNGVDVERYRPAADGERERARREFGLPPVADDPLFLTIGGIEARKNTLALLEAFARVRVAHPGARLAIAGGSSVLDHGAYARAFDSRRHALGLDTSVAGSWSDGTAEASTRSEAAIVDLGVIPDAAMPRLIGTADAFVFPSLVEGFGLVVLEALACGVQVVASAIAPFTEYLSAAEAVLVDPRDVAGIAAGMLDALEPGGARRRAPAGRRLAERFGWAASAAEHVRRYEEAIDARDALHGALAR